MGFLKLGWMPRKKSKADTHHPKKERKEKKKQTLKERERKHWGVVCLCGTFDWKKR